jgi:hypothetical protein
MDASLFLSHAHFLVSLSLLNVLGDVNQGQVARVEAALQRRVRRKHMRKTERRVRCCISIGRALPSPTIVGTKPIVRPAARWARDQARMAFLSVMISGVAGMIKMERPGRGQARGET